MQVIIFLEWQDRAISFSFHFKNIIFIVSDLHIYIGVVVDFTQTST